MSGIILYVTSHEVPEVPEVYCCGMIPEMTVGTNKSYSELLGEIERLVIRTKQTDLPNEELRLSWFELSERQSLPKSVRDFALDAMLTAADSFPVFRSVDDLEKNFVETIKPLLAVMQQGP